MWDRLTLIYDVTEQVQESKVNALVTQYEAFKMKKDESINQMFDRLTEITNVMESLGKPISNSELVRKILRSLPKTWEAKKTAIEEAKDLTSLSLQQLLGSLVAYENENKVAENKKTNAVAFKGSVESSDESEDESSSDSEDEDLNGYLCGCFLSTYRLILRIDRNCVEILY
ncbi:hypothetical protein MLD38_033522 [Melastoma candidum]|uniref:Uncharacterized protein n=1 Tax=Melastoma candidum TaxID=119954 RepID=A0ACB9M6U6_9MYRT|nr:hypothetical protein MLD38_033522 [Melastoma candidum]